MGAKKKAAAKKNAGKGEAEEDISVD